MPNILTPMVTRMAGSNRYNPGRSVSDGRPSAADYTDAM
jgi:hypothetical protein